jgi:hypothetical protein
MWVDSSSYWLFYRDTLSAMISRYLRRGPWLVASFAIAVAFIVGKPAQCIAQTWQVRQTTRLPTVEPGFPAALKAVWPQILAVFGNSNRNMFVYSIMCFHAVMYIGGNLVMAVLYYLELPFFEKYKIIQVRARRDLISDSFSRFEATTSTETLAVAPRPYRAPRLLQSRLPDVCLGGIQLAVCRHAGYCVVV